MAAPLRRSLVGLLSFIRAWSNGIATDALWLWLAMIARLWISLIIFSFSLCMMCTALNNLNSIVLSWIRSLSSHTAWINNEWRSSFRCISGSAAICYDWSLSSSRRLYSLSTYAVLLSITMLRSSSTNSSKISSSSASSEASSFSAMSSILSICLICCIALPKIMMILLTASSFISRQSTAISTKFSLKLGSLSMPLR